MLKACTTAIFLWLMLAFTIKAQVCHSFIEAEHKSLIADSIGLAPTSNYNLTYHRISVTVNPKVQYICGSVTSYFQPLTSLSQIAFDLTDSISADSVYYHGQLVISFTHTNNGLIISLPNSINTFDSVTVYYHGAPPISGFGSLVTALHDSVVPVLWTLSEPYGSRDWFPGKMTLTDKVDSLDMYINVPAGNRAASNGLLIDTLPIGNTVTYHWRERYPIANYLIAIGVSNYAAYADTVPTEYGNIYVLNYCYPEDLTAWHSFDTNTAKALQLYSHLFGQYPFIKEKYGHAQFGWGGGMEHQTMSFVCCVNYELINHEMAHQWFGDKLTCGSWSDIWLNEGFAVYLSALCYQYLAPEWWLPWRQTNLASIIKYGNRQSVNCVDTNSVGNIFFSATTYHKGASILHMLRWELGDSIFFKALGNYINDTALTYSFTKTQILKQHLEAVSGKDLTKFFNQWFYGTGFPSYTLNWWQHGTALTCQLQQNTSDTSVSFYAMDVPVRFYGQGIDTTLILHHTFKGQEYSINIPFAVDSITIDPELWLVSTNNKTRKLPDADISSFIIVYPNPVNDEMTIWYDSKNITIINCKVYDINGREVMQRINNNMGDYFTTSLQNLPAGVYVVKINTDSGNIEKRIIKY